MRKEQLLFNGALCQGRGRKNSVTPAVGRWFFKQIFKAIEEACTDQKREMKPVQLVLPLGD